MRKILDLRGKIEAMVRVILEEINKRHPNTVVELMPNTGMSKVKTLPTPATGKLPTASKVLQNDDTAAFELLRASLGVIFQERYCWTDERIDDMTLPEVFIALEHAMEYDAPSKKSVWDL